MSIYLCFLYERALSAGEREPETGGTRRQRRSGPWGRERGARRGAVPNIVAGLPIGRGPDRGTRSPSEEGRPTRLEASRPTEGRSSVPRIDRGPHEGVRLTCEECTVIGRECGGAPLGPPGTAKGRRPGRVGVGAPRRATLG